MANTLQTPPADRAAGRAAGGAARRPPLRVPDRPQARRAVHRRRRCALLLFLSIWPLIQLIGLSFTDYSATRDVGYNIIGFDNYTDILTSPVVHEPRAHDG